MALIQARHRFGGFNRIADDYAKKPFWRVQAKNSVIEFPRDRRKGALEACVLQSRGSLLQDKIDRFKGSGLTLALAPRTMIGAENYWELVAWIRVDSKEFQRVKNRKGGLHRFLGRNSMDLGNLINQLFGLPAFNPTVNHKQRARHGVKTLEFRFGFDVDASQNPQMHDISKKIQEFNRELRQAI